MKYLVVECHLSYAIVLDEEGRFLKTANKHYEVGQLVTDIIEMQVPDRPNGTVKRTKQKWISSLTAIAACLLLIAIPLRMAQFPYASVYMAINPEVRIDVNRKDVVVGLEGINGDGLVLIEDYHYWKKPLDLVMDELVDRSIEVGFLHEGGQITLTLDAEDGEWVIRRGDMLSNHLNEHLSEKLSVTIEVTDTTAYKHEVILPIAPANPVVPENKAEKESGDSGYGESDYGESSDKVSDYNSARKSNDFQDDDVASDYHEPESGGQTDYGGTEADDGQTNYGDAIDNGGQTDYQTPGDDDSQSSYGQEAANNQSDYNASDYDS